MNVAHVVGARPQFVKLAVVAAELDRHPVQQVVIHTGQHYDDNVSGVFFDDLEIRPPNFSLGIGSASHGAQTGRMLEGVERVLIDTPTDLVLVYGDTNSTLAGAIAARKLNIEVAHVESGLRSWNARMPEEVNRVLTDHACHIRLAPTRAAVANLQREGIDPSDIELVGDVMYDVALRFGNKAECRSDVIRRLALTPHGYALATIHRAENTDDPKRLDAILGGLSIASRELPVVLPLHPRTRAAISRHGLAGSISPDIMVLDAVGYLDMLLLEKNALVVATDSGGVQKEAFFYRVPCVTLRDETEWTELVELGWNRLVSPVSAATIAARILESVGAVGTEAEPYGTGDASARIAMRLQRLWNPP